MRIINTVNLTYCSFHVLDLTPNGHEGDIDDDQFLAPDFIIKATIHQPPPSGTMTGESAFQSIPTTIPVGLMFYYQNYALWEKAKSVKDGFYGINRTDMQSLLAHNVYAALRHESMRVIYGAYYDGKLEDNLNANSASTMAMIAYGKCREHLPNITYHPDPDGGKPKPRLLIGIGHGIMITTGMQYGSKYDPRYSTDNLMDILGGNAAHHDHHRFLGTANIFGCDQEIIAWRTYNSADFIKYADSWQIECLFMKAIAPYQELFATLGGQCSGISLFPSPD